MNTDETKQPADEPSGKNMASDHDGDEGIVIPEEFQQKVHALIHKAPKAHLSHVRDRVYAREDELRKEEQSKQSKGKKGNYPDQMSTEGMPQS